MKTLLNTCPHCGSEDIDMTGHDIYQDTAQLVTEHICCDCGTFWTVTYDLVETWVETETPTKNENRE